MFAWAVFRTQDLGLVRLARELDFSSGSSFIVVSSAFVRPIISLINVFDLQNGTVALHFGEKP